MGWSCVRTLTKLGVAQLPIDWNVLSSALQLSRDGENLKALARISELMTDAESDIDRAALVLGQATCHSHLGNASKSAELLRLARKYAGEDRLILSQVALSEASLHALKREYEAACGQYKSIKSEYHDLLVRPEHEDFAMELDSRLACTLVDAERYNEALPIFRKLFEHTTLEDKQRLQLFFSFALFRTGRITEAQPILFEAARGEDRNLAQTALGYLAKIEKFDQR
jgi:tetratricopeptide (TPR) repeat protein